MYLDLFIIQEKYWNGTICLSLKLKPEGNVQVQGIFMIPEGQFVVPPTVTTGKREHNGHKTTCRHMKAFGATVTIKHQVECDGQSCYCRCIISTDYFVDQFINLWYKKNPLIKKALPLTEVLS